MYLSNYSLKSLLSIRRIVSRELTAVSKARKAGDSVDLRKKQGDLVTDISALNVAVLRASLAEGDAKQQ